MTTDPWAQPRIDPRAHPVDQLNALHAMALGAPSKSEIKGPRPVTDDELSRKEIIDRMATEIAEDAAYLDQVKALERYSRAKAEVRRRELEQEAARRGPSSWLQVPHDVALKAAEEEAITTVGRLKGELPLCLFYEGKVNGVHAESEAGKSWLLLLCAAQEIKAGHHVLYVDYEDDVGSVYRRLATLGAAEAEIRAYFHYVQPTCPLTEVDQQHFSKLVELRGTLAVVDGVTEAMALEGLTGRDEGDVAKFHATITKPLAAAGWAVVAIDHTPHDAKRALGSQHKRSAITGVSYLLEAVQPIAPGARGRSRLHVDKDRLGFVRGHSARGPRPQWFADMVLDFTTGALNAALWPASPTGDPDDHGFEAKPPDKLCQAVLRYVEAHPESTSKANIRDAVTGRNGEIGRCVDWLVANNHLTASRDGNRVRHFIGPTPFDQGEEL